MSATSVGQWQALGDDRMDLVLTKQFEQDLEVLPEPILVWDAQFLDHLGLSRCSQLLEDMAAIRRTGAEPAPIRFRVALRCRIRLRCSWTW